MQSATHEIRQKVRIQEGRKKRDWKKAIPLLGFTPVLIAVYGTMTYDPPAGGDAQHLTTYEAPQPKTTELVQSAAVTERYGRGIWITADEYGDEWPWPAAKKAVLRCKRVLRGPAITVDLGGIGIPFALNGRAHSSGIGSDGEELFVKKQNKYGDLDIGDTDDIIARGIAICD